MNDFLDLADWRRRVAEIFAAWRHSSASDPEGAAELWRAERDKLFRSHPQSPLPIEQRARFGGLSYFAYDPAYRMTAALEPLSESGSPFALELPAIELPTSGSEPFSFTRIGTLHLSGPLAGQALPAFWMTGYAGGLFVPFRDTTSGTQTYAAGRYLLDTVKGADHGGNRERGELMLDFNLAYHPSCAYEPRWNCPLAPPQSRLSVAVPVGERLG